MREDGMMVVSSEPSSRSEPEHVPTKAQHTSRVQSVVAQRMGERRFECVAQKGLATHSEERRTENGEAVAQRETPLAALFSQNNTTERHHCEAASRARTEDVAQKLLPPRRGRT